MAIFSGLTAATFLAKYKSKLIVGGIAIVIVIGLVLYINNLKSKAKYLEAELQKETLLKNQYRAEVENLNALLDRFKEENAEYQKKQAALHSRYAALDRKYSELLTGADDTAKEHPEEAAIEINEDFRKIERQIACITGGVQCDS